MSTINGLVLRRILGRSKYDAPVEFGPDGWMLTRSDKQGAVIVTVSEFQDENGSATWIHASISRADMMPTYDDLKTLYQAAFAGAGYAYQVFAPEEDHINIHRNALHLWGRLDGQPAMPKFGDMGSI